jgi:hypothetical protein
MRGLVELFQIWATLVRGRGCDRLLAHRGVAAS